jgi:amino acid adenylation domain-containing protein
MIAAAMDSSVPAVAIIGISGRWPRARNVAEFWRNIRDGVDCISQFRTEELEVAKGATLAGRPNYVKARSVIDGADLFDAAFFGILPKEAEFMDPQQRLFLECCWEALEDAGCDSESYAGAIGVYAGCSTNSYFLQNVCVDREFIENYTGAYPLGNYPAMLGAIADSLATRVSYKLNLRGPSLTIQTACSTSLVAVCQACQALLSYQCDMALAGGVSVTFPQKRGYHYEEGAMGSADGHCRPFDARAQGTVFGSGAGVVLLKRLEEALADGDPIYAVIRGFAVNNDGSAKVGYTAPSVDGQANVIALAHAIAGVSPESIGYLEAHGTATPLGDPIEFAALTRAFRAQTEAKGFCALGTVKANVGHLEAAAGVTGLINAVGALVHKQLPPMLGFQAPNSNIDLENSPFYINTRLSPWKEGAHPRRAGVSSFGVGGTNAHVVLEEAALSPMRQRGSEVVGTQKRGQREFPVSSDRQSRQTEREIHAVPFSGPSASGSGRSQLILLSARSDSALDRVSQNLAEHLKANPDLDLASVAYTLQAGRRAFEHRRAVVCADVADAVHALESRDPNRLSTRRHEGSAASVVFMFPGQGSQYRNMGAELYRTDAAFRGDMDRCAELLKPHLGLDLRTALYPEGNGDAGPLHDITQTWLAQPALFVIEYALARLWMLWGVHPQAMIGHSVGEFVAACLAGVLTLEDALAIIAERARLMQQLPPGAMLSVPLAAEQVGPLLSGELSLAAANSPNRSVVSGPEAAIEAFARMLSQRGVAARRLDTSHAFHSGMMDPIIEPFTQYLRRFRFQAPRMPYISGVSGTWITAEEATDPAYWAGHFRRPVQFSKGFLRLWRGLETTLQQENDPPSQGERLFLEVGPGRVLCTLGRQHRQGPAEPLAIPSLPEAAGPKADVAAMLRAAGTLWLHGLRLNWAAMHEPGIRRCSLPTYPFERKRYWIEPPVVATPPVVAWSPDPPTPEEIRSNGKMSTPTPGPAPLTPNARRGQLRAALVDIFQELSGLSLAECDSSATFLEMGFDSLFLTQVTQALQRKFGLRITFRQLLDQQSTLDTLAAYLDAKLPTEILAAEPVPSPAATATGKVGESDGQREQQPAVAETAVPPSQASAVPVSGPPSPTGHTALEAIVREQLQAMSQLMAKQLEALRGAAPAVAVPPAAVSPPVGPADSADLLSPTRQRGPLASASGSERTSGDTAQPASPAEFKRFGPYKPISRGPVGAISEQQASHLERLIQRYTARTARCKELTQRRRPILADPRAASGFRAQWKEMVYPLVTVRSQGSRLWDIDGNEYIDLLNGFGAILFGHAPSFVTEAVAAQLKDGFEIGPQSPLAGEVAELFCALTGNERVTFCNTGSEAVMAAIRLARTVTARKRIVLFTGDYHGMFDEVLVKGARKAGLPHTLPIAPGIPSENIQNIIVLDYGSPEALEYIGQHARELAAVLVEPVQSRHPGLQPIEFLRQLRKITEASETALIFDEVVTGFRTHPGGVQALFGIGADLATYGKVVGGGLPIGLLAGRAKFMDALDGGMWRYGDDSYPETGVTFFAGTFVRHPLVLAAARAVLKHLTQAGPELQRSLSEKTTALAQTLNACFEQGGVPARVEHFSSWFYFGFPSDQPYASLLYYHLHEKGIHLREGFPCFLTTAHSDADIETVIRAFKESIAEMQEGGFFHDPSRNGAQGCVSAPRLPAEVPLTESQLEIWLSARLSEEASCAYNEALTLELRGSLNQSALQKALEDLVARHDGLRSTFDPSRDCLKVLDRIPLPMSVLDLSAQTPGERAASLEQLIRADAGQAFDLAAGPLVRVKLIRLEPDLHTLLFTTHHIVCDGWSTNVLLGELAQLYSSYCTGTPCQLPAPMPFREYALGQAKGRQSAERKAIETWWVEQFAQPVSPLELPTDRPRSSVKSFLGDTVRRTIDAALYQRLKRFGAQQGCTLFATLLAGFKTLLHRLTGQDDIVVGIPAAGQSFLEADALVGHCVNFLPLRTSFAEDPSVATLLTRVRGTLLDAYEHQNYTYGSLVQKLGLRRDPSRLPLVEVQFNLERVPSGDQLNFAGLKVRVDACPKSFVNFDLFLNGVESDAGLVLDCDYNRQLFNPATIERWLGHLQTVLEGMMADPRQTTSALPLLSAAERQRLIVEWNNTRMDYPRDQCVHQLIADQAARTPQAIAAVCGDQQLTYAELDAAANRLAHYLQKRGVSTGDRVAICLDRSLEMLIGVLGIMKSGAAYVPLDPDFPAERIAAVLEDARPSFLLNRESWPELSREMDSLPARTAAPSDLAYVIYTSGSTGKPKGVQIPHRAVVNLQCSMAREPGLSAHDTLLAVTTLAFDIAALELYLPLCVGAKVVLATRDVVSDGDKLLALLTESGATVMQATPATWRLLLEAGWKERTKLKVLCGGEALPRDLADALLARSSSVWNMYGPTETTIWSATCPVEAGTGPVPIGPPIANTEFYVLDRRGQPVPVGVAGELHIGGDGVARGYWNRPELTAEKFVPDPFRSLLWRGLETTPQEEGGDANYRLYKTGDLVRYRPDGKLEFLGRLDTQVKVRGFRIETAEVEHVLKLCPGIRDCVVVAREDTPGDKRLVAYFVGPQPHPTGEELRRFVSAKLPSYMVPSLFIPLDALPQTPNGKIDRRALPPPDRLEIARGERGCVSAPSLAPRTPAEQKLAEICSEVLKIKDFGIHDSLFDLGADSLQVFQIVARAKDAGLNVTPTQILAGRTIAAICELANGGRPPSDAATLPEEPPLVAVPRDRYRMQRVWANHL